MTFLGNQRGGPNLTKMSETRMFGDSVQSSPVNTLGRSGGGSLASLYQARKANDSATVEQIKQQFQKQIEQMMQASQRHESLATRNLQIAPPPQFRPTAQDPRPSGSQPAKMRQKPPEPPPSAARVSVGSSSLATSLALGPKETNIERGKSFLEARSAVQKQIEKMFVDSKEETPAKTGPGIKHTSHGVSHVTPEEEDTYNPPPPTHYGVERALKSLSSSGSPSPSSSSSSAGRGTVTTSRLSLMSQSEKMSRDMARDTRDQRALGTPERNGKTLSFDTSTVFTSGDNNNNNNNISNISLGNIDISRNNKNSLDRTKRASMHEDMIMKSVGVALREKKANEEVNINRRVSIHQDKFTGVTVTSKPPPVPLPNPPASLPSRTKSLSVSQTDSEYEPISVPPSVSSTQSSLRPSKNKNGKAIKHRIEYLGAVPLSSKATNLQALQYPMKELYFKNKALKSLGHSNLPGTLEILETGMKIQYIRELHKGVQEIFNSFPTIAVWAAVKFVHKNIILPTNERRHRFAFCPLISDPDSEEKTKNFYDLDYEEISLAMDSPHPPIFACVMRRAGMPKQLECHGFICQSSEDAIIIAANLYQSLLDTMRKNKASSQRKIENHSDSAPSSSDRQLPRQELTRRSIRKSVRRSDPPIRPPRRKRNPQYDEHQSNPALVRRKSIRSSTRSVRSNRSYRSTRQRGPGGGVGHTPRTELIRQSTRKSTRSRGPGHPVPGNGGATGRYQHGDLFTKVSIGRTKSFVKTGNQYNLQELFRELKEKEGVDSIDDVLRRVISPDGMSFNDIKPVYRELLLKLAMTMSQDEIFQRSKTIMANTKKKKKRHQPPPSNSGSLGSFFKSFSKSPSKTNSMASKKSTITNSTLSSNLSANERLILERSLQKYKNNCKSSNGKGLTKADISGPIIISSKVPESKPRKKEVSSSSGEDLVDDAYVSCSECGTATTYESVCTYEDCSYSRHQGGHKVTRVDRDKREASSGCETSTECEECDGDSCVETEKCYCSLRGDPRQRPHGHAAHNGHVTSDTDPGHTTDTTCYSQCSHVSRGSSRQPLSGCDSPQTAWKRNMGLGSVSGASCSCSLYSEYTHKTSSTGMTRAGARSAIPDTLRRKESRSGSGYTSNDSYASQTWLQVNNGNARNEIRDGRGSSGASSCSSSSPRSSPAQSQVSIQNTRGQNSKILLVSAADTRGNVMYKGKWIMYFLLIRRASTNCSLYELVIWNLDL